MNDNPALRLYAENATRLAMKWDEYSPQDALAPIADLLPPPPGRIADIGAGPGTIAAWLTDQGHEVVAVEPVQEFRDIGRERHRDAAFQWIADGLPDLKSLREMPAFDLLLLTGVWHHVAPDQRKTAMHSMANALLPEGRVIVSLRHGQDDPARGLYDANPDDTIQAARGAGLQMMEQRKSESIQQHNRDAGIHWSWLLLQKG